MASGTRTLCTRWYSFILCCFSYYVCGGWKNVCSSSTKPALPHLKRKKKKKIPACTPLSQEPHCWASKHRQGCDIAWLLCDYLMAGIKDEVAGMWRHSQLNQCVQFSFYVNRAAYKSACLNKLIIFLCNTVNILNLEYYKNCPSGIKKKKITNHSLL